jgi:hypothetical protein
VKGDAAHLLAILHRVHHHAADHTSHLPFWAPLEIPLQFTTLIIQVIEVGRAGMTHNIC